jgi:hypothetical protein
MRQSIGRGLRDEGIEGVREEERGMRNEECKMQNAECRLQIAECGMQGIGIEPLNPGILESCKT